MDKVCQAFLAHHGISLQRISAHEITAINLLEHGKQLIQTQSYMDKYAHDWLWELSQLMLDRTYEYVSSGLVLFLTNHFSSVEVISRTAVESAVSLMYILKEKSLERLVRYFAAYIEAERRQTELWKKAALVGPSDEQEIYLRACARKMLVLQNYEDFLRAVAKSMEVEFPSGVSWPTVADRFKEVGREVAYRTVYSSLSSQVHNDAEDTLNRLMAYSIEVPNLGRQLAIETIDFSRKSLYSGLVYYVEASTSLAEKFGLKEMASELTQISEKGMDAFIEISATAEA